MWTEETNISANVCAALCRRSSVPHQRASEPMCSDSEDELGGWLGNLPAPGRLSVRIQEARNPGGGFHGSVGLSRGEQGMLESFHGALDRRNLDRIPSESMLRRSGASWSRPPPPLCAGDDTWSWRPQTESLMSCENVLKMVPTLTAFSVSFLQCSVCFHEVTSFISHYYCTKVCPQFRKQRVEEGECSELHTF